MRHKNLAGEEGFEPSFTDPESAVLPLDDSPATHEQIILQSRAKLSSSLLLQLRQCKVKMSWVLTKKLI